jgi:hypothetical protein
VIRFTARMILFQDIVERFDLAERDGTTVMRVYTGS